jgi:uncharacterized protein (TIGR02300 family)
VAKTDLGTKRQCLNCGTKFYDLARDPIVCPKCGTVFQVAALKGRPEAVAAKPAEVEEDEIEKDVETVSLDEVEAEEDAAVAETDDVEIDADIEADDDTFLEEEEEGDDDVADLIDGDLEDDEEA